VGTGRPVRLPKARFELTVRDRTKPVNTALIDFQDRCLKPLGHPSLGLLSPGCAAGALVPRLPAGALVPGCAAGALVQ